MEDIVIENFNVFVIVGANKLISRYFLIFFRINNGDIRIMSLDQVHILTTVTRMFASGHW